MLSVDEITFCGSVGVNSVVHDEERHWGSRDIECSTDELHMLFREWPFKPSNTDCQHSHLVRSIQPRWLSQSHPDRLCGRGWLPLTWYVSSLLLTQTA